MTQRLQFFSGPLVGLAHGDLNAANIMIDALDPGGPKRVKW